MGVGITVKGMKVSVLRFMVYSKGPCPQIVYILAPRYPSRGYFKAKVCLFGYMDT